MNYSKHKIWYVVYFFEKIMGATEQVGVSERCASECSIRNIIIPRTPALRKAL